MNKISKLLLIILAAQGVLSPANAVGSTELGWIGESSSQDHQKVLASLREIVEFLKLIDGVLKNGYIQVVNDGPYLVIKHRRKLNLAASAEQKEYITNMLSKFSKMLSDYEHGTQQVRAYYMEKLPLEVKNLYNNLIHLMPDNRTTFLRTNFLNFLLYRGKGDLVGKLGYNRDSDGNWFETAKPFLQNSDKQLPKAELNEKGRKEALRILDEIFATYKQLEELGADVASAKGKLLHETKSYVFSKDPVYIDEMTKHYLSYLPRVLAKANEQLEFLIDKEVGAYDDNALNAHYSTP